LLPLSVWLRALPGITFLPTDPALLELETGAAWRRGDPPTILEAFLQAVERAKTAQTS